MARTNLAYGRRSDWVALIVAAAAWSAMPAQGQQQAEPEVRADHGIDVYVSEDALQIMYMREQQTDGLGAVELRGGAFYNEQRDLIGIIDALAQVDDGSTSRRLVFEVGPRAYAAFLAAENEDIFGVGLGGQAQYFIGRSRSTSICLAGYYAPDILTFGAANDVKDLSLRLEAELRNDTSVYAGYRVFEVGALSGDREVDDHLHVGFRRDF
jgi:hypothetical protein